MAGFRMHVSTAAVVGVGYGFFAVKPLGFHPEAAILAGGLTTVGGMLPDLDSDSGKPIREIFGLAAAVIPMLCLHRLRDMNLSHEGILCALIVMYLFIRHGLASILCRMSVHRGMWHSIPAMLIAGLLVYLAYGSPDRTLRGLLGFGVVLGFLSHLVLDEIYSVDFNGLRIKLKSSAGSALKLFSPSFSGTTLCYALLGILLSIAWLDWKAGGEEAWKSYWAKVNWGQSWIAKR
jgi:membrane-bound metal-dependent hydrolase YbcI (DUF457 family)